LRNASYVARSIRRTMALIVFAMFCFLACVFLLFVLVQWTRDAKRKTTTRPPVDSEVGETRDAKRPHIVGVSRGVAGRDRVIGQPRRAADAATELSSGRGSGSNKGERIAHERIARSYNPGSRN
jgi:hypothetical protein